MKKLFTIFLVLGFVEVSNADYVISQVQKVGTGWEADTACIYLASGNVVKIDLTTHTGRAELSIALSARAANDDLNVYFDDNKPLVGGCNTGTTVMPHGIIIMQ